MIGIIAAAAVVLVVACCGVFAVIGASTRQTGPKAAAVASVPAAIPTSGTPTTPADAVPTTPAAPTTPATPAATPPAGVVVPNLVGTNAAVANDQLRKLGFTKVQYGSQDKNHTVVLLPANWTVVKQSTKAGEQVPTDTLIVLTCTKDV